eukprot:TRINITY_DN60621_c0_g1_i1.p1 TRINITY_DN60621_c0_g1~~TRINITY_DN60621_c0_g1_i1.p1  ORF type:complete len:729 (+),score=244.74 TRINITY_DN60621_c0_g1_i1:83-2188(+)
MADAGGHGAAEEDEGEEMRELGGQGQEHTDTSADRPPAAEPQPKKSKDINEIIATSMQNWYHVLDRVNVHKGHEAEDGGLQVCRREPPDPADGMRVCMTPPGWAHTEVAWGTVISSYVRMRWDNEDPSADPDDLFVDLNWWRNHDSQVRKADTINEAAGDSGLAAPEPVEGLRVSLRTPDGEQRRGTVDSVEVEMEWDPLADDQPVPPEIVPMFWWRNFAFDQFDARLGRANHGGAMTDFANATARGSADWQYHLHWLQKLLGCCAPRESGEDVSTFYLRKCAQLFEGLDIPEGGSRPVGGEKVPPYTQHMKLPRTGETHEDVRSSQIECCALDTIPFDHERRLWLFKRRMKQIKLSKRIGNEEELQSDEEEEPPTDRLFNLGPTRDRVEWATRKMLKLRFQMQEDELNEQRFGVLTTGFMQFVLSIVLFSLGSAELDGGRFAVVLATACAGAVGVVSAFIGVFAALPASPNEKMMSLFNSCQVWMISLLTTFLLVEIRHMYDNELQCVPSQQTVVAADPCTARSEIGATLVVGAGLLAVVFFGCFQSANCLDTINDAGLAMDHALLFRYKMCLIRELQAPLLHRRPLRTGKERPPMQHHSGEDWYSPMEWNWRLELPNIGNATGFFSGIFGARRKHHAAETGSDHGQRVERGQPTPALLRRRSSASRIQRDAIRERRASAVSSFAGERSAQEQAGRATLH